MNTAQLLEDCKTNGVSVFIADGELKVRGNPDAIKRIAPTLKERKAEIQAHLESGNAVNTSSQDDREYLLHQLEQFALDTVKDHPEDAQAITRINNMAWEFMQADGMEFSKAIQLAAEIVVSGHVAACEAAYTDVMALWEKLKNEVREI